MASCKHRFIDTDELTEYLYVEGARYARAAQESDEESDLSGDEEDVGEEPDIDELMRLRMENRNTFEDDGSGTDDDDDSEEEDEGQREQQDAPVPVVDEPAQEENEVADAMAVVGCSCSTFCLESWSEEEINDMRGKARQLEKAELDLVILGKISATISNGAQVNTTSHAAKGRQRSRTNYTHEGLPICVSAFRYLNCVGKGKLKVLTDHYKKEGCVPREFRYKGRNKKACSYSDSQNIVTYLLRTAMVHALALPGRVPGFRRSDVRVLPSDMTIYGMWKEYSEACGTIDATPRSRWTFRRVWKLVVPYIVISKPSTDLCWTCQQYNYRYLTVMNQTEAEKERVVEVQQAHLKAARSAREYMQEVITKCREALPPSLGLNAPLSGPDMAHYCFDFAQQLHYPADPHQPGPMYFKTGRKCSIFGVCCPSYPAQINYLIDEAVACGKGANTVISLVHHFLANYGLGEKKLVLHADNCCGQNKNNPMMRYLLWRTETGLNTDVEINFLTAGHTKFSCDLCFGWLKKKTRRTKLSSLQEISDAVEQSAVQNSAQLVGSQDGSVIVPMYDWTTFLGTGTKTIRSLKKQHQFTMNSTRPGVISTKLAHDDVNSVIHPLWDATPEGFPVEIKPDGLDLPRLKYLFKDVREFCTPETRDLVCPRPVEVDDEAQDQEIEAPPAKEPKRKPKRKTPQHTEKKKDDAKKAKQSQRKAPNSAEPEPSTSSVTARPVRSRQPSLKSLQATQAASDSDEDV